MNNFFNNKGNLGLLNSDSGTPGIYRAKLIKDDVNNEIRAFIPGIHNFNFNVDSTSNKIDDSVLDEYKTSLPIVQWCAYNKQSCQLENIKGHAWVMFENGDSKRPVVLAYDFIGGSGSNTAVNGSVGNAAADEIYKILISLGISMAGACGILGNIKNECGFDINQLGDNNRAHGLCQWRDDNAAGDRWTPLMNWCKENNLDYMSIEGQTKYIVEELNQYPELLNLLKTAENSEDFAYKCAYEFCDKFERPLDRVGQGKARGENAKEYFRLIKESGSLIQSTYFNVTDSSANDLQMKTAQFAITFKGGNYGGGSNSSNPGNCEAWVEDVIYNVTNGKINILQPDAKTAGTKYGVSEVQFDSSGQPTNIPIGAVVWAIYEPHGHAAIYVGGGMVYSNQSGHELPHKESVKTFYDWSSKKSGFKKLVWGWYGNYDLSKN